jgi:aspartyl-tRNA(Asn)/glutamyl-tRNA(Gln) amidotransferase subunit A
MTMETVTQLAAKLRKGKLDALALTESVLDGIAKCDDPAIFTSVMAERALAEAKAARRRLKAGTPASPIDGIPIGWKDLFDLKGRVTTAGSAVLAANTPAARDAALVEAGAKAGLVSVCSLNMTEFAYSGLGLNPHYGTPRNPHDMKVHRSPGGSSSGSGAVVARGLLPVAIGSDTGGSIRVPASFNGIVGYKSSTGHYPMAGVFPLSRTFDVLGPLAQTVEDCVLVDAALSGLKKPVAEKTDIKGRTFIVPSNVVFDSVEDDVATHFENALSRIAKAGGKIKYKPFPAFDAILNLASKCGTILGAEALQLHLDRVHGPDAARMDQRVVQRIKMAEKMTAVDLVEIKRQRKKLIAATTDLIGDGIVVFPTTAHVAMAIAPLEADTDEFFRVNAKTLRNTMLGNFLDWCGLSIPSGMDRNGMPTGFLLSTPHGGDTEMLSVGLALESAVRG